jgi:hypothetical protein
MVLALKRSQRLIVGLAGTQAADAAFNVVGLYPLGRSTAWGEWAKQWTKDDLDRLGFPEQFRFVFPFIKATSVAGLLLGLRWRAIGRFTAASVVVYFVAALGFHVRARDPALKYVPAIAMLAWSCLALREFGSESA